MADPIDPGLRRFTVLHHTGVEDPHYDFMFETAETSQLTTFRLPAWPVFESTAVQKLRDHRRAYLEYVGPVSEDRGRVDRVDEGWMQVKSIGSAWELAYNDGRPFARLEPVAGGEVYEWFLRLLE